MSESLYDQSNQYDFVCLKILLVNFFSVGINMFSQRSRVALPNQEPAWMTKCREGEISQKILCWLVEEPTENLEVHVNLK